jgi:hypothetical protein
MKVALFILCLLTGVSAGAQSMYEAFDKKWSTYIGLTSFRTNFKIYNNWIIIGSNGDHLNDPFYMDENAGVKVLDFTTGELIATLEEGEFWDTDVNGVEVIGNRLYFGNDNEEFFCYDLKSLKEVWRIRTSGDVECAPALNDINKDGKLELIIVTEAGEMSAVDPEDGSYLWTYRTPSFEGFASSTTPYVAFKLYTSFISATNFYTTPELSDLNMDGVKDALVSAGDGYTYAVNGATGELLWKAAAGEYTHSIIPHKNKFLVEFDGYGHFGENESWEIESAFDFVAVMSKSGDIEEKIKVPNYWAGGDFLADGDKLILPITDGIAQVDMNTKYTRIIYFPDVLEYAEFPDGSINKTMPLRYEPMPLVWKNPSTSVKTIKTAWKHYDRPSTAVQFEIFDEWSGPEYAFLMSDELIIVSQNFVNVRAMAIGSEKKNQYYKTETPPFFFKRNQNTYCITNSHNGNMTLFEVKK